MRVHLIAVGRARGGPETELFEQYRSRLAWRMSLREVEARATATLSVPERRAREAAMLLGAVPPGARIVALDETGELMTSDALAALVRRWRDTGTGDTAILIGGADGLDDTVRARADLLLAFGRVTWPHMLVRAMVAEQVYRVERIIAGHPYHRG